MSTEMEKGGPETKLYELGYLFTPLVPAEEVGNAVTKAIKSAILAAGGSVASELEPKMSRLSYTISKSVEHRRTSFNEAYFGAIRLNLTPEAVALVEEKLKLEPMIIRFSFLSLPKDATKIVIPKRALAPRKRSTTPTDSTDKTPEAEVAPVVMTEEAIDKEIEGLLTKPA